MIERLELFNFESHKHTVLELSHGVYIISGNSNAGKSSLFRALRFVILNQPNGDDFINFNAQECKVIVKYDGHTVEAYQSKK